MATNICRICLTSKRTDLDETKFKNIFTSTESFNNKQLKLIDAIIECAPLQVNKLNKTQFIQTTSFQN